MHAPCISNFRFIGLSRNSVTKLLTINMADFTLDQHPLQLPSGILTEWPNWKQTLSDSAVSCWIGHSILGIHSLPILNSSVQSYFEPPHCTKMRGSMNIYSFQNGKAPLNFSFYYRDSQAESQRLAATISTPQPTISQSSIRRSIISTSETKTPLPSNVLFRNPHFSTLPGLFYTDWRHQDALPTTQLPVSDLANFMTGNSTPFIDWQPIWKNHLDLRLATRMKQAFKFRNLTKPPMNSPFSIPFLAHSSFNQNTTRWLRNHVLRHKEVAIPLHLPTAKLREAAFSHDSAPSSQS